MAIEAFYPSRCQSKRNNPLFARERRRKKILGVLAAGFGVFCLAGLHIPPGPAQANSRDLHRVAQAVPAAPKRNVRIIQLYHIPSPLELGQS
jgi:hypothetical protein